MVKVLVMSGYGINCERESAHAFEMAGANPEIVHVNDLIAGAKKLADYDILMFPGGFSYGDDTGSGNAFANKIKNHLWADLTGFIEDGKLVLGVCNGFQVMTHLGLFALPDGKYGERIHSMESNDSNRYECRWVHLKAWPSKCVFTKGIDTTHIPVAHGEGRFLCEKETLEKLKGNGQVVFTYCDANGRPADGRFPLNPNGAMADVAAICDRTGRVMGMMPHPERGLYSTHEPEYHLKRELARREGRQIPKMIETNFRILKNAVEYAKKRDKNG